MTPVTASSSGMSPLLRQLHSLKDTIDNLVPKGEGVGEDEIQDFKIALAELCINIKNLTQVERGTSLTAKRWMQEVQDLCYDTEDYLDRIVGKSDLNIPIKEMQRRRRIAADFLGLKARAEGAGERYTRCVLPAQNFCIKPNWEEASSSQQHPLPAESSSVLGVHGHIADLIDGLMDRLVKLLGFNAKEQFKVVSILGFAGVGKTTLARSLYHKYGGRFECRAFVRVSRNPDLRRIVLSMLSQIKSPRCHVSSDVQYLFDNVKKHLQGKRYLIVIDDLWASTTWDIISHALPRDNSYSTIITTTQTEDVAKACCSYNPNDIFKIRPLNSRQFNGLPSEATIMVANLLECNPTIVEQWMHLQNSLPSRDLGTNSTFEGMNELLSLIYDSLPQHFKTCFLHFNMYPEDYTIRKDDLVKQWVAEGFLDEVGGQDTDMAAKRYFDELINRGLIQPVDTNYNDEVLSCTVHYIVLDFIRYKSKEENFSTITIFKQDQQIADKVRRFSVQFGGAKGAKISGNIIMRQIRSLIYFGFFKCVPSIIEYDVLRVLILHVWADKENKSFDLSSIQKLFRLRYLKVACNVSVKLPSNIGRLQYLETLDLDARVVGNPMDITHLPNLLHLLLPRETNYKPYGIDRMTSLCTLKYFQLNNNPKHNVLKFLRLTNLQDLHLICSGIQTDSVDDNLECLGSIIRDLGKLKSLILDGGASTISLQCDGLSNIFSSPSPHLQKLKFSPQMFIFSSLPEWIGKLSKLSNLKIAVRALSRNNIDILKRLTTLTVLSLSVRTTPTDRIVFDEGFHSIRYFKFTCTAPCLSFGERAMSNVVKLKLVFNASSIEQYDLSSVCFQYLTSLEDISLKFGDASSYLPRGRNAAESAMAALFTKHPSTPIVNVKWAQGIFPGDEVKSISAQKRELQDPEKLGIIFMKDLGEQVVQEKKERSTAAGKGKHKTPEKKDVNEEKDTDEKKGLRENISREDIGKQDASRWPKVDVILRTSKQSESSSRTEAQSVEADIRGLIPMILGEAATADENKEECQRLAQRVSAIRDLLPERQDDLAEVPPSLVRLRDALQEAHKLVMACQKNSRIYRLMARQPGLDLATRFRDVLCHLNDFEKTIYDLRRVIRLLNQNYAKPSTPVEAFYTTASTKSLSQDAAKITWKELHSIVVQEFSNFSSKELLVATNNFAPDREIGEGSFGPVYMGILPNGKHVAIKRIAVNAVYPAWGINDFRSKVKIVSSLHHRNIVRLLGCCTLEKKEQLWFSSSSSWFREDHLLVFEYMENGSLWDHLFGPLSLSSPCSPVIATWETRIKILLGASRAIDFLHSCILTPIVHRNIKSSSILLDSNWEPRLSGFYRRAFGINSVGYMDPEYFQTGSINSAIDVYSFGIVMVEVLTGIRPINRKEDGLR
uniref:Protein kinase domain-containing protein n=1 Tax=Leersia perrieri TaxID=77586 RepID=A0A0D9XT56_9ORYZ